MLYTPDRWVVIELTLEDGKQMRKVLGGWGGGYMDSDWWKLSSKIVEIEETDTEYTFTNLSGSVYRCRKQCCGFTNLSRSIYQHFLEVYPEVNMTIIEEYNGKH